MRNYKKNLAPYELSRWKAHVHPWKDFASDANSYGPVKASLLMEQIHLCCYCEVSIVLAKSHIEHFQPRNGSSGDTSRTYDYSNLACSCDGGVDENRHCGNFKGALYEPANFLKPSEDDTGDLFLYDADGGISPMACVPELERSKVRYMIRILNLNCAILTGRRRAHAAGVMKTIEGMLADPDGLEEMARFYLTPGTNGRLQPFFSLSRRLFGNVAEMVLRTP